MKSYGATHKQHYISRGILKHFADNKKQLYEFNFKSKRILRTSVNSTMFENDVYEYFRFPINTIEKLFAIIEKDFFPILDDLIRQIEKNYIVSGNCSVYIDDLKKFMPFFLVFYFRSAALLKESAFNVSSSSSAKVERLLLNILDIKYLKGLSNTINNCYETAILVDEDEEFLVSDQYISTVSLRFKGRFYNVSNRQIGMQDTMLLLPLSSKFYVVFFHGNKPDFIVKDQFCALNTTERDKLNSIVFANAYEKCVCRTSGFFDQLDVEKLVQRYPTEALMVYEDNSSRSFTLKKEVFWYSFDEDLCSKFPQYLHDYFTKIKGKTIRNSPCLCGSGKKFKNCCRAKYNIVYSIYLDILNKKMQYAIPGAKYVERDVHNVSGDRITLPDLDEALTLEFFCQIICSVVGDLDVAAGCKKVF